MEKIEQILENRFHEGDIVRHFKWNYQTLSDAANLPNNYHYRIVGFGKDANNGELQVVYQALYNGKTLWVRSAEEFCSEVDRTKYPDCPQHYRFKVAMR